jgi:hypothetical protein
MLRVICGVRLDSFLIPSSVVVVAADKLLPLADGVNSFTKPESANQVFSQSCDVRSACSSNTDGSSRKEEILAIRFGLVAYHDDATSRGGNVRVSVDERSGRVVEQGFVRY